MLRHMLATDVLVHTIRERPGAMRRRFETHDGEICVSSVTAMELLAGAHGSAEVRRNLDVVEGLLARLDVLPFDLAAAEQAAQIRAEHAGTHALPGEIDLMIAGHARARALCLVTASPEAFAPVAGLRLEVWADAAPGSP